jgi:S1-C subfamily serine protease
MLIPVISLLLLVHPDFEGTSPQGPVRVAGKRRTPAVVALERIKPALVIVRGTGEKQTKFPSGLGVLVDAKGIVVMPSRLVANAATIELKLSDGREFHVRGPRIEAKQGLAIVKLESDKPFPHVEFADSDKVKVTDWVLSLDLMFPDQVSAETGVISRICDGWLQMDSARSFPCERDLLFNMDGKLIGIWKGSRVVPGNRIKQSVDEGSDRKTMKKLERRLAAFQKKLKKTARGLKVETTLTVVPLRDLDVKVAARLLRIMYGKRPGLLAKGFPELKIVIIRADAKTKEDAIQFLRSMS